MKIDQWVRFIIRYGFILFALFEWSQLPNMNAGDIWIYRACASWLLFIEISVVYPD